MDAPTFYAPDLEEINHIQTLDETASRHAVQVLRMKEGETLQLTNGKGWLAVAELTNAHKNKAEVKILSREFQPPQRPLLSLGISLLKNAARIEWLLEKATEIGVIEIIPMICQRTERQAFRHDRMNGIVISAMLQSQQTWLPVLHQPTPIEQVITSANQPQKLIAHCLESTDKSSITGYANSDENKLLLIGPEGDFTPAEIEQAIEHQFLEVSLGNTRLRTETAAMVGVAVLRSGL
jgi:16S rRNA (uracil1498-N3)-methyltransferase